MKPIERVPIVQQVVQNLKECIMSGEMQPGQKLPTESELCKKLSVGRSTVREAFCVLQASGFIEIKPGRGAFVVRTSEVELDEIIEWFVRNEVDLKDCIEVRTAMEPLAVKLAIERGTENDIAQLARVHVSFLKAVSENNTISIAEYDERFHDLIVEISRNKLLISINRKVSEFFRVFRNRTFQIQRNTQNAVEPHTNIMNAILARDVAAGQKYMLEHLHYVMADLETVTDAPSASPSNPSENTDVNPVDLLSLQF